MANNANPTPATTAAENLQAAVDAAVSAERNRLAEIDSVASLFDPALVHSKCTVRTLGSNVTIQMVGSVFVLYCEIPTRQ